VAATVALYAEPTVPLGTLAVTMERADITDTLKARDVVWPAESPTWTVKLEDPAVNGVPDSNPDAPNDNPAGNCPETRLNV
jgi:hypothetical protein